MRCEAHFAWHRAPAGVSLAGRFKLKAKMHAQVVASRCRPCFSYVVCFAFLLRASNVELGIPVPGRERQIWGFGAVSPVILGIPLPGRECRIWGSGAVSPVKLGIPLPGRESQVWGTNATVAQKKSGSQGPSGRGLVWGAIVHGEGLQTGLSLASCVAVKSAKDGYSSLLCAPCPPPVRSLRSVNERPQRGRSGAWPSSSHTSSKPQQHTRQGRRETARYGLRAQRIGEASNPGPRTSTARAGGAGWRSTLLMAATLLACLAESVLHRKIIATDASATMRFDQKPVNQSQSSRALRLERRLAAAQRRREREAYAASECWLSRHVDRVPAVNWQVGRHAFQKAMITVLQDRFEQRAIAARERARYGMRGRRIGEASNPGPDFRRRPAALRELHARDLANIVERALSPQEHASIIRPDDATRNAALMLTSLAGRAAESPSDTRDIPQCIRRQRWSDLNVPLMWSAASECSTVPPVLDWVTHVTVNAAQIQAHEGAPIAIGDALRQGWTQLRSCFRAWGIRTEEDLIQWIGRNWNHRVEAGQHLHSNVQEHILNAAVEHDGAVVNLEIAYVAVAMHLSAQPQLASDIRRALDRRRGRQNAGTSEGHSQATISAGAPRPAGAPGSGSQPTAAAWDAMAAIDLEAELRKPAQTVREPPRWFRGSLRQAFLVSLRGRAQRSEAAWKLFILTPRMLLRPTEERGDIGKAIFLERLARFQRGEWSELLTEAEEAGRARRRLARELDAEQLQQRRLDEAERRVSLREITRARVLITSTGLAPGNNETLDQLKDPQRRPTALTEPLPDAALRHRPANQLKLESDKLAQALRGAGRGSAPDLAGMRYEHLRVLIEDDSAWNLFAVLAQDFARAELPASVLQALRMGRMTALKKDNGQIRGIVAGSVMRRLVCKTVAVQFSDDFLERTAPFQFALKTRAGTDALAHAIRLLTDMDPDTVVVGLDGVGAFDHVKRARFFEKLLACEELRPLLPLVSALYGSSSRFLWYDDRGGQHVIEQGEGGEQGCPLMPALFALAQHDALEEASGNLLPSERLFAFLDDLYVVTCKARAAAAFEEVASCVERKAGVQSHLGKLRAWCRSGGPAPADLRDISEDVWTADLPDAQNGLVILGTPLGKAEFVEAHARQRLEIELRLLREIPKMKDPQKAWVLLSQSAVPRSTHMVRVLPPTASGAYAHAHDEAVWDAFCEIFQVQEFQGDVRAKSLSSLPGRLGGLGLRSASLTAKAAYWASWVDALPVIARKMPDLVASAVADLEDPDGPQAGCLQEVSQAHEHLRQLGAGQLPAWQEAAEGLAEPPQPETSDDFEYARGWQWYACSILETFFETRVLRPTCEAPQQAMILSQGGSGGAWLRAIPSERIFEMRPLRFQVSIRRRLRWPLPLSGHQCRGRTCRFVQDELGDHAASCHRSGNLKARSRPIEKVWVRVLREGGARVRENVQLRDAGIAVEPSDGRNIEIVVTGLPIEQGIPVAVDATMVSPLHADGTPHSGAETRVGVALARGRHDKEVTYPELLSSPLLRLLTAGVETGGRLSKEALDLLSILASHKAVSEPPALRAAAARAWRARWVTMVSVVCQDSLAATLIDDGVSLLDTALSPEPLSVDVWLDGAD